MMKLRRLRKNCPDDDIPMKLETCIFSLFVVEMSNEAHQLLMHGGRCF